MPNRRRQVSVWYKMSEQQEIIPREEQKKKPLLSTAKHMIGKTLAPLRTGDTHKLIEEFTSEVALVAEGLSEDQARISHLIDNVAASQTTFENETLEKFGALSDELHTLEKQLKSLQEKQGKLEKAVQEKKLRKTDGWTAFLRQLTWLIGVFAGAWIVVTVLNKLL